jgi:hypothetical protein
VKPKRATKHPATPQLKLVRLTAELETVTVRIAQAKASDDPMTAERGARIARLETHRNGLTKGISKLRAQVSPK